MARGSDINQRIVLQGADEVRRHLEEIAASGQKAGNQTRAALIAATQGASTFTTGARAAGASSGQLRFALQNLSFQVNDVATSLASGGDVMRVFAQQGGQIFQAFQQGGGLGTVIGGAATAIRSMISPMALAAGGALALVAAIGALIARSIDSQTSAKQFSAQLQGLGKSSKATGEELEQAARRLKDIGIGIADARKLIFEASAGGLRDPKQAERIVRIGNDLNRVFGEGTLQKFVAAAAKGGDELREFAERLGIVPKAAAAASVGVQGVGAAISASTASINDALVSQSRSIADELRQRNLAISDLTRKRGTAEEEITLASTRRIEEINRQSSITLNDLLLKRNQENAKALAEHNKQITDAAQKAAEGGDSVLTQIENRVKGLDQQALGPTEQATRKLGVSWQEFLTVLNNSQPVQSTITDFTNLFRLFTDLNTLLKEMAANRRAFFAAGGTSVATGSIPGLAGGGMVRGPGTGTSDSVPIMASTGEFVLRAAAVRKLGLDVVSALNMGNIMPRSRARFATGGLVGAGGSGSRAPINLHIAGEVFGLESDDATAQRVIRFARKRSMLSAGRKPSTA